MRNCLLLGGTTDTKSILKEIDPKYDKIYLTVATDYGYESFKEFENDKISVLNKKFDLDSISLFLEKNKITEIVDTTHPYATEISSIAQEAANRKGVIYIDKKRSKSDLSISYEGLKIVKNYTDAVEVILKGKFCSILITTGSKNADKFSKIAGISYIRVLPSVESIEKCLKAGFSSRRIIAMQGPFSVDLNVALIKQFKIDCLVTKNSGKEGGFEEKLKSCIMTNTPIIVVENE